MKKLGKILLIILIVAGIGYGAFMVFVNPGGFVDKTVLVNSYITNLSATDVCEEHFNTETQLHCGSMTNLLKDHAVVVTNTSASGENIILTVTVDGVSMNFTVSFITVEVTGLKSFFNKTYYVIDFMI